MEGPSSTKVDPKINKVFITIITSVSAALQILINSNKNLLL